MSDAELVAVVRQGSRYFVAAKQDAHPVIAHLHANYAVQLFDLAHAGATRARVRRVAGIDIDRVRNEAKALQNEVQTVLLRGCPVNGPSWLVRVR